MCGGEAKPPQAQKEKGVATNDLRAATRAYSRFLRMRRYTYDSKRVLEEKHPARRWRLIRESTTIGSVVLTSACPSPDVYSKYLNDKLSDIHRSTNGAPPPDFTSNALLPSAYRRHHSTETAVLKVVSDIRMAIDRGNVAILLLLDISAAFDAVDHNILIERLDRIFAIRQMALDWLRSYLKNRNQLIVTASADPVTQNVSSGVPQGSVLGPILFSLYVAKIEQLVARHGFHSHQYVDDTQISVYAFCEPHNTPHLALRMAECFSDVASWTSSNRLRLNGGKTEAIWFHPARRSMPTPPVQLSGVTITPSTVVRNLGVYLDTSLSMENHAGKIAAACFFILRVLRKARHSVPREPL